MKVKKKEADPHVLIKKDVFRKVKIHTAISGETIIDFVSNTLEKEIKNVNKKKSANIA